MRIWNAEFLVTFGRIQKFQTFFRGLNFYTFWFTWNVEQKAIIIHKRDDRFSWLSVKIVHLSCGCNCDDQSKIHIFHRSSNIWSVIYSFAWWRFVKLGSGISLERWNWCFSLAFVSVPIQGKALSTVLCSRENQFLPSVPSMGREALGQNWIGEDLSRFDAQSSIFLSVFQAGTEPQNL